MNRTTETNEPTWVTNRSILALLIIILILYATTTYSWSYHIVALCLGCFIGIVSLLEKQINKWWFSGVMIIINLSIGLALPIYYHIDKSSFIEYLLTLILGAACFQHGYNIIMTHITSNKAKPSKTLNTIHQANTFAIRAHGNQQYGDKPYVVHLDAVAELLTKYGETAQIIAYLHDVIEDTEITYTDVKNEFVNL